MLRKVAQHLHDIGWGMIGLGVIVMILTGSFLLLILLAACVIFLL